VQFTKLLFIWNQYAIEADKRRCSPVELGDIVRLKVDDSDNQHNNFVIARVVKVHSDDTLRLQVEGKVSSHVLRECVLPVELNMPLSWKDYFVKSCGLIHGRAEVSWRLKKARSELENQPLAKKKKMGPQSTKGWRNGGDGIVVQFPIEMKAPHPTRLRHKKN